MRRRSEEGKGNQITPSKERMPQESHEKHSRQREGNTGDVDGRRIFQKNPSNIRDPQKDANLLPRKPPVPKLSKKASKKENEADPIPGISEGLH